MKPVLFIVTMWLAAQLPALGQLIQKDDGKFYDNHNRLYTGTYIEYYPSGGKRIEINLLDGLKHGTTLLYFESQNIQEIRSYHHNEMDGTWTTRNDKGIQIAEANYRNGIKHGKWCIWDDNGTKRYEMEYHEGKKSGKWYIWDEKGVLVNQKDYPVDNTPIQP
jgi:antitoxin component YwqK of YwqJK toxin-antitoxin module